MLGKLINKIKIIIINLRYKLRKCLPGESVYSKRDFFKQLPDHIIGKTYMTSSVIMTSSLSEYILWFGSGEFKFIKICLF